MRWVIHREGYGYWNYRLWTEKFSAARRMEGGEAIKTAETLVRLHPRDRISVISELHCSIQCSVTKNAAVTRPRTLREITGATD